VGKFLLGMVAMIMVPVVLLAVAVIMWVHYNNAEVRLRNQFSAQIEANKVVYDNVWKVISQQAQIADGYKEGFRQVWHDILTGQNEGQRTGSLQVFVNRINPQFDPGLYKKLMTTVDAKRTEFLTGQKKLIDVKREHDNIRTTMPGSFVVGSKPELELVLVTSGKTTDAFETRREDDVDLKLGVPPKQDAPPATPAPTPSATPTK
jgi:hypothetical protein